MFMVLIDTILLGTNIICFVVLEIHFFSICKTSGELMC